ncbi:MAG TPA: hypothetical protein VE957_18490 [Terriglobales bacterium]|nr:hypothetical protein [Terriglobales bacterium]
MKKLVHFALAALFLLGIASAQNVPAIDVFGGYSYLNFDMPASFVTSATTQRLALNGWGFSASVGLFHHLAVEADVSGHQLNDCDGSTFNCSNFSYIFGPRFTLGDRSSRITAFVHGLVGRDRLDLPVSPVVSDMSVAVAAGAGLDYWFFRHVGVQLGPADYMYTRHLKDYAAPSQSNFRVSGGIVFRFGGEFPPSEPKPSKEPKAESTSHRSWTRPWHKTTSAPSESQPRTVATNRPAQPAQPAQPLSVTSRGMSIASLGALFAPQEFDGAKIVEIVSGGVAEMASLKVGDLIKSVDGKAVRTPMELAAELSDKSGKVRIGILRGTWATETVILLGAR